MTDRTLPEEVTIGPGRMEEAERVADLWVALAEGQRRHGSHLRAEANRASVLDSTRRHVVAEHLLVGRQRPSADDGECAVVGFVTFGPESGTFEQSVNRGRVENIYVVPDERGCGIGSALLRAAEEALAAAGADVVSLDVMADNDAARRFYRRHGYGPHRVTMERPAGSDTHTSPDD